MVWANARSAFAHTIHSSCERRRRLQAMMTESNKFYCHTLYDGEGKSVSGVFFKGGLIHASIWHDIIVQTGNG